MRQCPPTAEKSCSRKFRRIASAWGRVGAVTMLLVLGHLFAIHGKSLLFLITDPILITASIVVLCVGSTNSRKAASRGIV
jgi:hypothetical protein